MINLITLFFGLLLWGGFFFRQIDCWHSQGHFVQIAILILFSYSFFVKQKNVQILNKALGAFICWAGLITSYSWIKVFAESSHYPVKIFMPFFNLLCMIILYKLIIEHLNQNGIEKILTWLKYSVIIMLFYCAAQYFRLDEFYKGFSGHDELVGTIGNSMHLSGLLAILQPLFFKKSIENILSLCLIWILILLTGSASGLVAAISVILFWFWFKNRKLAISCFIVSIISLITLHLTNPTFFYNSQRFEIWKRAFEYIKNKFITGYGLGTFGIANIYPEGAFWQHSHNEYLQIVFEIGCIGLILIIWVILDYYKVFKSLKTDLSLRLASIFFGFCLLNLVTFFGHLWITSCIAILVYAGIYCLKNEELNQCALV